jgi:hypothetical protein
VGVGSTLDAVNEVRDLGEEGVIVGERVSLLVVVSRSSALSVPEADYGC